MQVAAPHLRSSRWRLAIMDFEESLNYDVKLLRYSPAVPKHVKLYGFFYEISSRTLTEVVRDIPAQDIAA